MTDLEVCRNAGPPATVEELTKFLLIAPEKAAALRAEIRAVKKAGLAAAIYEQKQEEQRQLAELILDASVLMGEMAKQIPKAQGTHSTRLCDSAVAKSPGKTSDGAVASFQGGESENQSDSAVDLIPTKGKAIQDLGFSRKQVERFEMLANNKDLVEKEKAQAREEGRIPTRTRVIDMAQARKKALDRDIAQIDADAKLAKAFVKATHAPLELADDPDEVAAAVWRNADGDVQSDIEDIDLAIQALSTIKAKLMNGRRLYGSA